MLSTFRFFQDSNLRRKLIGGEWQGVAELVPLADVIYLNNKLHNHMQNRNSNHSSNDYLMSRINVKSILIFFYLLYAMNL